MIHIKRGNTVQMVKPNRSFYRQTRRENEKDSKNVTCCIYANGC